MKGRGVSDDEREEDLVRPAPCAGPGTPSEVTPSCTTMTAVMVPRLKAGGSALLGRHPFFLPLRWFPTCLTRVGSWLLGAAGTNVISKAPTRKLAFPSSST